MQNPAAGQDSAAAVVPIAFTAHRPPVRIAPLPLSSVAAQNDVLAHDTAVKAWLTSTGTAVLHVLPS